MSEGAAIGQAAFLAPKTSQAPEPLSIRRYDRSDVQATLAVFQAAVIEGASSVYSEAERRAWAPLLCPLGRWTKARMRSRTWVVEVRKQVVAFGDLTGDGEIAMLYVLPALTRRGIGRALLKEAESAARALAMPRLTTRASLIAQPLFARCGFRPVMFERVLIGTERLARTVMTKDLQLLS